MGEGVGVVLDLFEHRFEEEVARLGRRKAGQCGEDGNGDTEEERFVLHFCLLTCSRSIAVVLFLLCGCF